MAGKQHWRIGCTAFAISIFGSVAYAQTAGEPPAQTPVMEGSQLEPSTQADYQKVLDTISVTATRNPIKSFEYPGMVSVIGREEIQTRQASSPDDILKFLPNVEFTDGPRRTGETPSIRGFSGPDVIVLFDGARQNFGSAHDGRFFVDPSLLKQVEVLRGSASSLYGSGGTGGVIEFRTIDAADFLEPGEKFGATASGGYQSVNDEWTGTFNAYGTPTEGLDLVGSFTKRDSGTIELGDGNELSNTDDDVIVGFAKGSLQLADHHRVEFSFMGFNNDAQEPNNGQGAGSAGNVDKEIRSNTFRGTYSYNNPADNLFDLDFTVYYTDFQADELRLDGLGEGPAGELLKRDVDTVGLRLDNRSRLTVSDSITTTFTYGGEYYHDEQDGAIDGGNRPAVPDAKADFFGLFAQAEITISEPFGVVPGDFLIIPGLRYDDYKTKSSVAKNNDESEVSPRVGVSYLPTDWLMVFVNYGHAFRAPTFDELYLTGTHFQIPIGPGIVNRFVSNPDLKPQKTRTVEFGGGLTFEDVVETSDQLQVKASHFRMWGDDFIDLSVTQPTPFVDCNPFIPGNCDGTTNSDNVPNAELWGTEVEGSYESSRYLVVLGYSAIDGENEDSGAKLGVLTPDQFTINTGLKLPECDSIIGWRMLAATNFNNVNDPEEKRGGYAVHDFYLTWQPTNKPVKGLRIDLGVDNAFDKAYSRVFTGATEAGVNFKALASYSFKW